MLYFCEKCRKQKSETRNFTLKMSEMRKMEKTLLS